MKQAAYRWFYRMLILAMALGPSLSDAQHDNDGPLLQQARVDVAKALGRPAADVSFAGLRLIPSKLGPVVCGSANGKRFLADATKTPSPPQIEGALSQAMFDYLWNARCRGMSAAAAADVLTREMKH
ncbi:MAG TPA: hypothetical protein VMV87_18365 [Burkholderiales bacterium]|nr:hypothetical protein [Burkholderiales bacterium]